MVANIGLNGSPCQSKPYKPQKQSLSETAFGAEGLKVFDGFVIALMLQWSGAMGASELNKCGFSVWAVCVQFWV